MVLTGEIMLSPVHRRLDDLASQESVLVDDLEQVLGAESNVRRQITCHDLRVHILSRIPVHRQRTSAR